MPTKIPAQAASNTQTNTPAVPASVQIETVAGIKYPFFAAIQNGESITVAGVLNSTDEKSTPYGPVKRFKGDFIIRHHKNGKPAVAAVAPSKDAAGKDIPGTPAVAAVPASTSLVRSGTCYFPAQIGSKILELASKIPGGYEAAEFKLSAAKTNGEFPSVSFAVEPRVEGDRVLSLLNS